MKKEVHLCNDTPPEYQTQSRYTPDNNTVEGPVYCGVCDTQMDVRRDVCGPRGYAQAMSGGKSMHDVFECPLREEEWHRQVVALREESRSTSSSKHKASLLQEADEVLEARCETMKVSPLKGN